MMNGYLAAILAAFFLMAPVRLRADVRWQDGVDVAALARVWGVPLRWRHHLQRTGRGHRLFALRPDRPPQETPAPRIRQGMAMVGALLRGDRARRFLMAHVHMISLDALAVLSLEDAAATALLSGAARSLTLLLPRAWRHRTRLRVQPGFPAGRSSLRARCIVSFRLGSLLIAAALAFIAWALEAREHRVPLASKEG